ncbi:MAG: hypothetical protein INQ03_07170 [Candidatus Heimdallarchaeota archaeon]|nr:hypothetical protein [Candidatus Heimdallarchaeota archaeon]
MKYIQSESIEILELIENFLSESIFLTKKKLIEVFNEIDHDIQMDQHLLSLHENHLIHIWKGHDILYELTVNGYDLLSFNQLFDNNSLKSIGKERGIGKESLVIHGLNFKDREVIIKIHRVGYTSFTQLKKQRRYIKSNSENNELIQSAENATNEFHWLKIANELKLNSPEPLAINRHIIIEELLPGVELYKITNFQKPSEVLESILDFIDISWNKGKFVHGDLSEYNVIVTENEVPYIIDFAQSISVEEPNALFLLKADVTRIVNFFQRRWGTKYSVNSVLDQILSKHL